MKIELLIAFDAENATLNHQDTSVALLAIASYTRAVKAKDNRSGNIRDDKGNTVGRWTITS